MDALFDRISTLKGIGAKRAEAFLRMGIETPYDLLYTFPRSYLDFSSPIPIQNIRPGETAVVRAQLIRRLPPVRIRKNLSIYKLQVSDGITNLTLVFYNNPYHYQSLKLGEWYRFSGKIQSAPPRGEMTSPRILSDGSKEWIFPNYPMTSGISLGIMINTVKQAMRLMLQAPFDWMPDSLREEHDLLPLPHAIFQIHFPSNPASAEAARRRLAFDELLQLQLGMLLRRAANQKETSSPMDASTDMTPFFRHLPFSLTQGQQDAIAGITRDLCGRSPMNRLLQGDVGSGKTAVAAAACYFAVQNGVQCALMAPTEILAAQHYQTLCTFLEPLGIRIGLLTGSLRAKEKREIQEAVADGTIQLLVGTHAIFQKEVSFRNLGLVITDEQHRFGVLQRSRLADKGGSPHKLVMSATPIPRTLALMIYGDLDISLLQELPAGRAPVVTDAVTGKSRKKAYDLVRRELDQQHQGYIVCPMIDEKEDSALKSAVSYAEEMQTGPFAAYRVGLLHGKMKPAEKEAVMEAFRRREIDLLVCTTVIEVGVDVPNATIMLIENTERFGLSQLHQLRGRVGRGKAPGRCILIADNPSEDCQKRMAIMNRTASGFDIAEADLQLRGPGDFFGERQHGLPPLKAADLSQDTKLLHEVHQTAEKILQKDPDLSLPEHHYLKLEVIRLFHRTSPNGAN